MKREVETRVGHVVVEERGEGTPLVLLHGAGHDRRDFAAIVPTLSRRFRTLAVDWPGFGESVVERPASLGASVLFDVLEDVVAGLALPPAVVLGNSVGGAAAVRLAARVPSAVRGLVLVDPGGFTARDWLVRAFCRVQGTPWVRRLTGGAFARSYLHRRSPPADDLLARLAAATPANHLAHAAVWRSFAEASASVEGEASQVRCPVLVVWGRHDPVLRLGREGVRVRAAFPDARFEVVDTGHVPFVEDPEGFLACVGSFLDGLRAPVEAELPHDSAPVAR